MSFLWRMLPYILLAAVIASSRFYFYVFHFQVGRTIFFLNIFVGVIAIFIYLAALRDVYRDFVANLLIMKLPSINKAQLALARYGPNLLEWPRSDGDFHGAPGLSGVACGG